MPRTNAFRIGVAFAAAVAGVILAITSVAAHSAQTSTLHITNKSAIGLFTVAKVDALKGAADEQADAAELAAKLKAEAAEANQDAAEAAAEAQQDATEPAPPPCVLADQAEDATEKAADQSEDATETPCNNGGGHDKDKQDHESKQGAAHEHSSDASSHKSD